MRVSLSKGAWSPAAVAVAWLSLSATACAGATTPGEAHRAPRPSATLAISEPRPLPSVEPSPAPAIAAELPTNPDFTVEISFTKPVHFLASGEDGRLAVLVDEGDAVVPFRFEKSAWQRLDLPASQRAKREMLSLGMYFGRDNRPRLMGFRRSDEGSKMVYLRFREGAWQDQRSEVGSLAGDNSALYGVLGEADPEVVCKRGGTCLIKSRRGWKEVPATIPESAVVRAFAGKGYALTQDGVFLADDGGFTRVGPVAAWRTRAAGFVRDDQGRLTVVEPETASLYLLNEGEAAWRKEPAPMVRPGDVATTSAGLFVVGEGGIVLRSASGDSRIGEASWSFERAIAIGDRVVCAGPSGVAIVRRQ